MTDDDLYDDDFYDDDYCLPNGLSGEALAIPSANPKNFFQAISDTDAMHRQNLWGKFFLPDGPGHSGQPGPKSTQPASARKATAGAARRC